jgi:hypothetical protein
VIYFVYASAWRLGIVVYDETNIGVVKSPTGKQVLAQQEKLVLEMTFTKSRHACLAIKTMNTGLLGA